jgi:uncharacterized protein YbbC (DUF1343 family)
MKALRSRIYLLVLSLAGIVCQPDVFAQDSQILTGIDVLEAEHFSSLVGKNVGLITNQTGIDRHWNSTIDVLYHAKDIHLVALFSPEHGIRGTADTRVASSVDSLTRLPIYSLYGETRRPTEQMLKGVDVLVFDVQDIGTRFYTYIGTMKNCMEEAAKHDIKFVVLDRPNPINGVQVEGPVLDSSRLYELGGVFPLPIRHGMTIGELANMFNREGKIGVNLEVVKMKRWKRSLWFDQTGLPWVPPSPRMKNLYEATLYPGFGLLERTNVEHKKGVERPFEELGAPWVDGVQLAEELNRRRNQGVYFVPIRFTPPSDQYAGQLCEGVAVDVTDRNIFRPVACGIEVLQALYKLYPAKFNVDRILHLTRSEELIEQIKKQVPLDDIAKSWQRRLAEFKMLRDRYLLYK